MSSLFGSEFGAREKQRPQEGVMRAMWCEGGGVLQASSSVSSRFLLGLTLMSWPGQKTTCPGTSKKTARFLAQKTRLRHHRWQLSSTASMQLLCLLKHAGLIAGLALPHAIDDAHPNVGQSSHGHTVGFALGPFALIIGSRPGLLQGRLPGKLVQGVAQWFQASKAFVRFGIIAALERHRSGPSQSLHTVSILVTLAVISPLSQQARSQPFSHSRQRLPEGVIWVGQKKALDLLVIGCDLLDDHLQLFDQREHQARFRAHGDLIGSQCRTMHGLND